MNNSIQTSIEIMENKQELQHNSLPIFVSICFLEMNNSNDVSVDTWIHKVLLSWSSYLSDRTPKDSEHLTEKQLVGRIVQ